MKVSTALLATCAGLVGVSVVDGATCTNSQVSYMYELYKLAAAWPGCAPYAVYSSSGIKINWSCSSTDCTPTMMELASKLPSCEYASNGVNNKAALEDALYNQCKLCTYDQQKQTQALWQSAAATPQCSPYSSTSGSSTSFSWPCSATGCTAVLKDLATKVPDCYSGGVNEKTRILKPVSSCSSVNPSPATPVPSKTSSGADPGTPATPAPPSGGGGSSGTCTESQASQSQALWEAAAATSACSPYATVTTYYVQISWPCSASSCTAVMEQLADDLPNCVYEGETESEKESIKDSVKICTGGGGNDNDNDNDNTGGDFTPSPSSTSSYSSQSCSSTEVSDTVDLYLNVAQSDVCAQYAIITTFSITITAPCSSPCVRQGFQKLATQLDDCYYNYDAENKKEQVNGELDKCSSSPGRRLDEMATGDSITISYFSNSPIKSPSSTTNPPLMSEAAHVQPVAIVLVLAIAQLLLTSL